MLSFCAIRIPEDTCETPGLSLDSSIHKFLDAIRPLNARSAETHILHWQYPKIEGLGIPTDSHTKTRNNHHPGSKSSLPIMIIKLLLKFFIDPHKSLTYDLETLTELVGPLKKAAKAHMLLGDDDASPFHVSAPGGSTSENASGETPKNEKEDSDKSLMQTIHALSDIVLQQSEEKKALLADLTTLKNLERGPLQSGGLLLHELEAIQSRLVEVCRLMLPT